MLCQIVAAQVAAPSDFARQIRELSEPAGTFDTDNLISNERSYLHVLPALKRLKVAGGAYIGVGPDQNFSYIAASRPSVAFLIDVRRDNLLLHLLFKAIFAMSNARAEYLSHLFGRALRPPSGAPPSDQLDSIIARLERAPLAGHEVSALRKRLDDRIARFGVPLSARDFETIDRFHRTFIDAGLDLKFQSWGRAPRAYYPTYRELLLETDLENHRGSFLNSEDDYQYVRRLQERDLIIPVVGNLAGPSALASIGRTIRGRGHQLSAFYVSNVELYLFQDGQFPRYAENVAAIPRNGRSVLIRSIFNSPLGAPGALPGYASASVIQRIDDFARRTYRTYAELIRDVTY
jgi:hypothetical protein